MYAQLQTRDIVYYVVYNIFVQTDPAINLYRVNMKICVNNNARLTSYILNKINVYIPKRFSVHYIHVTCCISP